MGECAYEQIRGKIHRYPTLYKEGVDYRFTVDCQNSGMEPKVKIFSHVMTEFGATPKFTDTEIVAVADENGVYTVPNLQG